MALAASMTCWDIGGRRSHTFVYFSTLRCAGMTGWIASAFFNLVVMSLKTTVGTVCYCGAFLDDAGRLVSDHRRNQTRTCLSVGRNNVAAMTHGDFTVTA